jgi:hypothetical protein
MTLSVPALATPPAPATALRRVLKALVFLQRQGVTVAAITFCVARLRRSST